MHAEGRSCVWLTRECLLQTRSYFLEYEVYSIGPLTPENDSSLRPELGHNHEQNQKRKTLQPEKVKTCWKEKGVPSLPPDF